MGDSEKESVGTEGHRARLKSKLLENGASSMTEAELLEIILFYVVPRRDCRVLAEQMLAKYATIEALCEADPDELEKLDYIKGNAVVLLKVLGEILRRNTVINGDASLLEENRLKEYLIDLFKGKEKETVYALYFDRSGSYIGRQVIFRGSISKTQFSLRAVTEGIIRVGGKSVVLAHNHPSNLLIPSGDDIISTRRIAAHLAANEIELLDHYIVGENDAVSILNP